MQDREQEAHKAEPAAVVAVCQMAQLPLQALPAAACLCHAAIDVSSSLQIAARLQGLGLHMSRARRGGCTTLHLACLFLQAAKGCKGCLPGLQSGAAELVVACRQQGAHGAQPVLAHPPQLLQLLRRHRGAELLLHTNKDGRDRVGGL